MITELKTDPEVADFIDTLIPELETTFGKLPAKNAIIRLYDQDPDQVLELYLDDQLAPWLNDQAKTYKLKNAEPVEITIGTIRDYLSKRYYRFLEYSDYHAALANLDQQGNDVLHEVLLNILLKDEGKLIELYGKKKKDGYRELDYYILRMIKLNCHSKTSPYRWRFRQPHIDGNATSDGLMNGDDTEIENFAASYAYEEHHDEPDEDAGDLLTTRYQIIRDILAGPEFSAEERSVFTWKFLADHTWKSWEGPESKDWLSKTYRATKERVAAEVEKLKEQHQMSVIHDVFSASGYLDTKISEREFLLLRQILSQLQEEPATATAPEGHTDTIKKLERRLLLRLEGLIREHDINNKF